MAYLVTLTVLMSVTWTCTSVESVTKTKTGVQDVGSDHCYSKYLQLEYADIKRKYRGFEYRLTPVRRRENQVHTLYT